MKREYSKEEMEQILRGEAKIPKRVDEKMQDAYRQIRQNAQQQDQDAGERTGENKPEETTGKSAGLESRSGSSNAEFGSILCCCGGKQISSGKSGGER